MNVVKYTNNFSDIASKNAAFTDLLMGTMAAQIEVHIKTSGLTPIRKGNLRSSARSIKVGANHYEVVDTAAYAAAQEVGYRHNAGKQRPLGKKVVFVKHPRGGGAHYFTKSIAIVIARANTYIDQSLKAVGLKEI